MDHPMSTTVHMALAACAALACVPLPAQQASPPGEPIVQGVPPDERVDVTADGIPDLVIAGYTDRTADTEQGLAGWYRRGVRTLPGTSLLLWSTHNTQRYFTLADDAHIDTAMLAERVRFKQLSWTPPDKPVDFPLLERPFGPGISQAADGWYGTGDHYQGTHMILRSHANGRTRFASFTIWFLLPSGRIGVTGDEVITVPTDFAKAHDLPPPAQHEPDLYFFGHEREPQVMVPPGLPPDEEVDLNGDEQPDVVITGHVVHEAAGDPGFYERGITPAPGTSFLLMRRDAQGPGVLFRLPSGTPLTPEELNMGLHSGRYRWSMPATDEAFCPVLRHPCASANEPPTWTATGAADQGDLVYRSGYFNQVVIGIAELMYVLPGGQLGVNAQNWVEEGKVLQVR